MMAADTYAPDINGAARFAERFAVGLVSRGHEVHMIAPSPTGEPGRERLNGVLVHRMRSHRYPTVADFHICLPWEVTGRIKQIVHKFRPDVAHVQAHFVCGRYLAKHASDAGVPLVATNHFMPENLVGHLPLPKAAKDWVKHMAWQDLAKVYGLANYVTAPTPRATTLLEAAAGIYGAEPISCGIDGAPYEAARAASRTNKKPTILFVGRLDEEKRVDELIKAVAKLPDPEAVKLEIVGDGSCASKWRSLSDELGLSSVTTFHGFVDEEELVDLYGRADIFVMPGIAELQSLATLEAMCASTPVICANAMALPHLCQSGNNGFLFEPGKIDQLSAHILTLVSDSDLRARFGEHSRNIAEDHAIGKTLDRFEEIYATVIEG
ncbi:glycosyltransferase [Stomatohabitans albus]|uniref:glycosyltransferase n=1 Tax=Stomatohabitans albus TaxID=3110766 RepID=UPI00300D92F4